MGRPAAATLPFKDGHSEVLFAGMDEGSTARSVVFNFLVRDTAKKGHRGASQGFQPGAIRAIPNHDEPAIQSGAGLNGQIEPLVGDQGATG